MRHFICPVCDYPHLSEPARTELTGGSFEICPSCGFQFGVTDDDEGFSFDDWRKKWENGGMKWSSFGLKPPPDWQPVRKFPPPASAKKAPSRKSSPAQ